MDTNLNVGFEWWRHRQASAPCTVVDETRRIVAETYEAGASVSEVARRHDVNSNLLFTWRRTMGVGALAIAGELTGFVPAVIGAPGVAAAAALAKSPAGTMEIVLCGGERVIVDRTVDAVVLAARRSVTTPR